MHFPALVFTHVYWYALTFTCIHSPLFVSTLLEHIWLRFLLWAHWLIVTFSLYICILYQELCCICLKRRTICYCYCLRLTEFCKSADRISNWTTLSLAKSTVNGLRERHRSHRATMFCYKLNAWFCLVFPAFGIGIVAYQNLLFFRIKINRVMFIKLFWVWAFFKEAIKRCWWWKVKILFLSLLQRKVILNISEWYL